MPNAQSSNPPALDETPEYRALRDQLVILLVNGAPLAALERLCAQRGLDVEGTATVLADARGRIAVAAHAARAEQVGIAVLRLNDLYAHAVADRDWALGLNVQREINRVLALDLLPEEPLEPETPVQSEAEHRLARVLAHLAPLALCERAQPVDEHARLACLEIIRLRGASGGRPKTPGGRPGT